ncbi:hypothetical protein RRG08_024581 [Elysia crispata]|uniref:Uncharacterized protein n=1 Tax=Elysia crispata TaxID=231223 RepID=A0AAE1DN83_9GAST|nr:hypothetical protein RRG08_024581 [Elysia crispata]
MAVIETISLHQSTFVFVGADNFLDIIIKCGGFVILACINHSNCFPNSLDTVIPLVHIQVFFHLQQEQSSFPNPAIPSASFILHVDFALSRAAAAAQFS